MEAPPPPPARPRRLSEEFDHLLLTCAGQPFCLRDLMGRLPERGSTFLLLLMALPFCLPVPLPGLSTLFGLAIALVGFRLACRREPWLPRRLLHASLSLKVLQTSRRLAGSFEWFLRPRWPRLTRGPAMHTLCALVISLSGVLLLLPLPFPFTNQPPAFTVVLLAAALLERDGLFVLFGLAAFLLNLAFFASLYWGGAAAWQAVQGWW